MATETVEVRIAGRRWRVRCLADRLQRADPLFGVLWPAGLALAEEMSAWPVAGKRVLEVGCGLALPSLVLRARGADVTASDHQPEAESFLRANAALNGVPPPPFRLASWQDAALGAFDLVIGADLLYERGQAEALAGFIERHAPPQVVIADPGRRELAGFSRLMEKAGFQLQKRHIPPSIRLVRYRRAP